MNLPDTIETAAFEVPQLITVKPHGRDPQRVVGKLPTVVAEAFGRR